MRKSLLTIGAACVALSSVAGTRILYKQNFESVASPEAAGWSYAQSMSILSDGEGKYLQLSQGNQNGRSAQVSWGEEIFMKDGESVLEDGTYHVYFEFSIENRPANSKSQYNSCFTIFTNHAPVTNQPYRTPWSPAGYWQNYLFDMSQVEGQDFGYVIDGGTIETVGEDGTKSYAIDYDGAKSFDAGKWYGVDLDVNINTRKVEYKVANVFDADDIIQDGAMTVPETDVNGDPISMYAQGLFIMVARYNTIFDIDNIEISYESAHDFANPPTIALSMLGQDAEEKLNLNLRGYSIKFLEGETLHVIGTDGKEETVEYEECDGSYSYITTNSGTLKAWTTYGDATSEVVVVEVDCNPCELPAATATISAVSEGFVKTYTLTVSNTEVPLQPTIFIDYKFVDASGATIIEAESAASGVKVQVPSEGTLFVTTDAFGYKATTVEVKNDIQFETKKAWDFARMTREEITAALPGGTWNVSNTGTTSGFSNWTGRKEIFYYIAGTGVENEDGVLVYDKYLPFGFVSEDNTTQVLNYYLVDRTGVATTAKGDFFEGLTIFPDKGKLDEGNLPNVGILEHIGLFNDQLTNNTNRVVVNDLEETDFVYMNVMGNYGRGDQSNHPICATDEEFYAQLTGGTDIVTSVAKEGVLNEATNLYDVSYALNRIDAALMKIVVYKPIGGGDDNAVEGVEAVKAIDNNWYSIDGVRVAEPTRPGLYIHGGKKIIVK